MILPPNKQPNFFFRGKAPDLKHICSDCGFLLLVFFPPNKPDFEGIKIACVCGKIYTFINKLKLMETDGIKDVIKKTTTD